VSEVLSIRGLYTRVDGAADADPVLLLHGGPGASHDYLYPQMLFLAERHRVITYDQRGGGRSRNDDAAPVTWQTHVDDLEAMIDHFQLGSPTIIGYSWGGLLAMLYAIQAAAGQVPMPSRLVLISPAPITRAWRDEFERTLAERSRSATIMRLRDELAASGLRESNPEAYRQRGFELSVAGYFADPLLAKDLTPFRVVAKVQQSVWASLGDFDLRNSLQTVRVPSLVVHGRHDPIPLASAESVAQRLDARFVVLQHSGHVPYVEQLTALSSAIEEFLAATATSPEQ
jgi:proline iminopeptidase